MKRHFSAKRDMTKLLHAPDVVADHMPYCDTPTIFAMKAIAKKGEIVTCKLCLRKLKRHPQYANALRAQKGIDCRGWVWKE